MKKLLFSAVNLDVGGIEKALVTLLNYLANQKCEDDLNNVTDNKQNRRQEHNNKYEITLVLEKKQGLFLDVLDKNIKIIEYTPSNNKIVPIRKAINLFKQIRFKAKYKNRFDFSCSYATYSLPGSFVARTASENSALWVHSEYLSLFKNNKEKYIEFFNNIKSSQYKKIIFVSKNAETIFKNIIKDQANKTDVIYNLTDCKEIISKANEAVTDVKKDAVYTFLNVGRHTEEDKKITRIIESAKRLNDDGKKFRILLVGDGNKTETYKQMVRDYNLEDKIIFLGKKRNPYPYYKIADCFLLTSEYEGFPVVYIESMILGLPIITTNVSDSEEIIKDKFGIVTSKDVEEIYKEMKQAIDGGVCCKEKFDCEEYNKKIEYKIEQLLDN